MSLHVLDPGLYSLIVDKGRPRSRALGVPLGGAADRTAFTFANALLGNALDAPALEVTLRGPTLRAEYAVACVVFGAPFGITVNDSPHAVGTTFTLEPGATLRIAGTPTGARAYLTVAGGFDVPRVLESRSALDSIKLGDTLRCAPSRIGGRSLPFTEITSPNPIRVLDGPQRDWFTDGAFWQNAYEVQSASNRMGLRLRGPKLPRREDEMVSEAVAPGAVQVANDGQPIVLGVDGQTIGGYPKIAHVIRADLDRLAQLRPGEAIRFQRVDADAAEQAARESRDFQRIWIGRLQSADGSARIG